MLIDWIVIEDLSNCIINNGSNDFVKVASKLGGDCGISAECMACDQQVQCKGYELELQSHRLSLQGRQGRGMSLHKGKN